MSKSKYVQLSGECVMQDHLEILETAISDVGYWRWWAAELPKFIQIEFGGVQLWHQPQSPDSPPSGIVALRFQNPAFVSFLTENNSTNLLQDWPTALHEDRIEPFSLVYDKFTLRSQNLFDEILSDCQHKYLVGDISNAKSSNGNALLAFRAQNVGLAIKAQNMEVVSKAGSLSSEQILDANKAWWTYWAEYWDRRSSNNPLPKDYACEVTIPLKEKIKAAAPDQKKE